MMKKTYTKPTQKIVHIKSNTHLLTGSDFQVNSYRDGVSNTVGDTSEE